MDCSGGGAEQQKVSDGTDAGGGVADMVGDRTVGRDQAHGGVKGRGIGSTWEQD